MKFITLHHQSAEMQYPNTHYIFPLVAIPSSRDVPGLNTRAPDSLHSFADVICDRILMFNTKFEGRTKVFLSLWYTAVCAVFCTTHSLDGLSGVLSQGDSSYDVMRNQQTQTAMYNWNQNDQWWKISSVGMKEMISFVKTLLICMYARLLHTALAAEVLLHARFYYSTS